MSTTTVHEHPLLHSRAAQSFPPSGVTCPASVITHITIIPCSAWCSEVAAHAQLLPLDCTKYCNQPGSHPHEVVEAEELAASLGMGFMETSAKGNCNVDLAFDTLANTIQQALWQGAIKLEEDWGGVRLIQNTQISRLPSRMQHPGPCRC